MKMFWKIKKCDRTTAAIEIKKSFPVQFKGVFIEEIEAGLLKTDLEFYKMDKVNTPWFIRLTLPLALLTICALFILLPLNYIVTGYWGYKHEALNNWLRALGI